MSFLKPGDKVRLKHLDEWTIAEEAWMEVREVVQAPESRHAAKCVWIDAKGRAYEKVYPLDLLAVKVR